MAFAPVADAITTGRIEDDSAGRVTTTVMLNGQGPYTFILDTGANRTVLAPEVVERLGITPTGPSAPITGVTGAHSAQQLRIASLETDAFRRSDVPAIVLGGHMLGDADGMIGGDGFANLRMSIDLDRRVFTLEEGGGAAPSGFVSIPGELRRQHLLVVDVVIDGVRAKALVDTGAEFSLINRALATRLRTVRADDDGYAVSGAGPQSAFSEASEVALIRRLRLGSAQMGGVRAFLADLPVFRDLSGREEPAIVIGMDVWRRANVIAIDYARAELQLRYE
ncbi:MAG: retroviral-like aspartic protease family protein [Caulobacterales bacterium]